MKTSLASDKDKEQSFYYLHWRPIKGHRRLLSHLKTPT